jgi:hypothetical protein
MSGQLDVQFRKLTFTGPNATPAELEFAPGMNLIYGASNTGKSFAVKSLAFMLAALNRLPDITERRSYDRLWLAMDLGQEQMTLMRALAGGGYDQYRGYVTAASKHQLIQRLSAKHDQSNNRNLSQYLLEHLKLAGKQVATNASGNKRSVNMRDIAKFCIVDETRIQSEVSPVESGQFSAETEDRSVFRLLLSGWMIARLCQY